MQKSQRGMVTAEFAVASLLVGVVIVVLGWSTTILGLAIRCQDTAWEVARQEARSDRAASQRARSGAPPGAKVEVDRGGGQVRVLVKLDARPWVDWLPAVPLRMQAKTLAEPKP